MNDKKYIGLDVHQATISVAVMDATGKVVMESILETKAATILWERLERLGTDVERLGTGKTGDRRDVPQFFRRLRNRDEV